jgi:hypothetical protein
MLIARLGSDKSVGDETTEEKRTNFIPHRLRNGAKTKGQKGKTPKNISAETTQANKKTKDHFHAREQSSKQSKV